LKKKSNFGKKIKFWKKNQILEKKSSFEKKNFLTKIKLCKTKIEIFFSIFAKLNNCIKKLDFCQILTKKVNQISKSKII